MPKAKKSEKKKAKPATAKPVKTAKPDHKAKPAVTKAVHPAPVKKHESAGVRAVKKEVVSKKKQTTHVAAAVVKEAVPVRPAVTPEVAPKERPAAAPVAPHKVKPVVRAPYVSPAAPTTPVAPPVPAARPAASAVVPPAAESAPVAPAAPSVSVPPAASTVPAPKKLEVEFPITVKDLSVKLQEKPSVVIKALMDMKIMAGINQTLDENIATAVCAKFNCTAIRAKDFEAALLDEHGQPDVPGESTARSPIVTFMGHVDHGKTSLLDAIRKTKVAEGEHGGITQHIGAYHVKLAHGEITFLDTPGHEAFTSMRARGARVTDIVVLVVAADDGIMPQTIEAIDHARAAGVSIIVAINKIDKPQAMPDKVKKQLGEHGLAPEDWGGKTITVPVSAKTGEGIDDLLEMILLEAQMLELKSNPQRPAKGVVIEAKMTKGKGPTSTLLVENGTLRVNDAIIVGALYGKIRAMFNDRGIEVETAGPSIPVEVLGIDGVPEAGEQFFCIDDEKKAKELAERRKEFARQRDMKTGVRVSLEDLHAQIAEGKLKELKIVLKSDVQGSLEAIKDTLEKLHVEEIKLEIIHSGVGPINSSDVILALASNALVVGFNVSSDDRAAEIAAKEGIEIKTYNIIYELANEIKAAIEGMLEPKLKKVFLGRAEIRKVFKLTKSGLIAGCFVVKGKINRANTVTVVRNGEPVFEGKLSSLKRFKDDVREVAEGFECGMAFAGFTEMREGDVVDAFEVQKILRKI
jgi:translation initiation factor IF-2